MATAARCRVALGAIVAVAGQAAAPGRDVAASYAQADQFLVVDCLLLGQVRMLWQRTTHVSARRPARLPARDCQIRGGEYVAYDRADSSSALAAWQPLAEQGDVEARVIVGEIYERGLGVAPDHAAAAHCYRLAADAGDRRAQVNLGHLYESGLGVERDPRAALDWYRRAAGGQATIELDSGPPQADAELQRLRERERQLEISLASLRAELDASRSALGVHAGPGGIRGATCGPDEAPGAERACDRRLKPKLRALPHCLPRHRLPDRTAEPGALQQELARRQREAEVLDCATCRRRARQTMRNCSRSSSVRDIPNSPREAAAERERLDMWWPHRSPSGNHSSPARR